MTNISSVEVAEFIANSSKLRNFRKSSQIFVIAANFLQILGLDASSQRAFSQRKVVSQFEKWNEQPCVLIMPDLQELHWTNEPKVERICATCLGYAAQTVYLLGPEPWAALDHATPLYTALGDTVKKVVEFAAESITSIKSCENNSNSAQNSVKATDIRTNATDVETRKNIVQ